jgi:hypothetical protein
LELDAEAARRIATALLAAADKFDEIEAVAS